MSMSVALSATNEADLRSMVREARDEALPGPLLLFLVAGFFLAIHGRPLTGPLEIIPPGIIVFWWPFVVVGLRRLNRSLAMWAVVAGGVGLVLDLVAREGLLLALPLLAIPAGMATLLLSVSGGLLTATALTFLLWLAPDALIPASALLRMIAAAEAWLVVGLMWLMLRPLLNLLRWSWVNYERDRDLLERARDYQVQLKQALKDLATAHLQLTRLNRLSEALRQAAEEARRSKEQFAANVSHELRTPLNMIIGLVDLMVHNPEIYEDELPPELVRDLEIVHRNCEHLYSMINDVLDLSRVEAGRLALHREPVDLRETISNVFEVVRPLAEKKHLYLRLAVADDLPPVECDRTRISQVILNLVSNAARFTDEGGIVVQASWRGQHALVDVTDTGPGIAPEDLQSIFEPFRQAPSGALREHGGSGLGLSISKQLVELHGGRIWVDSQVGTGTTFHVDLPIAPLPEHARPPGLWIKEDWAWHEPAFTAARTAATPDLRKPRVVVYDATDSLGSECAHHTDKAEFVQVSSLRAAAEQLHLCPAQAVVVNAATPEQLLPALDLLRRESEGTPIIGSVAVRPTLRAQAAGALGHLVKPVTRSDLLRVLGSLERAVHRVLAVDDDPEILALLSRMLHVCDSTLEVQLADSGAGALERMLEAPPDLVLLDLLLPDMTGWQVLERMRDDERLRSVPVLLVSAQDPADAPVTSQYLLATMGEGMPLSRLLRCSLVLSSLLVGTS